MRRNDIADGHELKAFALGREVDHVVIYGLAFHARRHRQIIRVWHGQAFIGVTVTGTKGRKGCALRNA